MPFAVIFPGQGAAVPGAGEVWHDHPAWSLVDEAEIVLGRPLGRLLLEADAEELATTRSSQLAVLLSSLLAWNTFSSLLPGSDPSSPRPDLQPSAFAGHSLGQITALIASGAVGRHDGLRLAAERADLSQRSAEANPGGMAALVGATLDTATEACAGLDAWVANDNAPGQVVIAGTPSGLEQATQRASDLGARRVRKLAVGHAFHTPLLADAARELRPLLDTLPFDKPSAPIVANTDAQSHTDPETWPTQLSRHLVEPVRWRECQQTLAAPGVDTFVEIGPGNVLAGLARRTVQDVRVVSVTTPESAAEAARTLSIEASVSRLRPVAISNPQELTR